MSDKKKTKTYSKETEEKLNKDLDELTERRSSKRKNSSENSKKDSDKNDSRKTKESKKEKKDTKRKDDRQSVIVDIPRKALSSLLKSAGLDVSNTNGVKTTAKISVHVKP